MQQAIQIREATVEDVAVIVDFNVRLARETQDTDLSRETLDAGVRAVFDDPKRGRYFVTCTPDRVVGQLMITTEWSDWRNGLLWWIQSVYVHPDYRGRGIFRDLYRHVEQLASERSDVVGIRLYVHRENHAAQKVYQRLGMRNAEYFVFERELT